MRIRLTEHSWIRRSATPTSSEMLALPANIVDRYPDELRALQEAASTPGFTCPKLFRNAIQPFTLDPIADNTFHLESTYLIGAAWLVKSKSFIQVVPKLERARRGRVSNRASEASLAAEASNGPLAARDADYDELDENCDKVQYLRMLMTVAEDSFFDTHFGELLHVDFSAPGLPLVAEEDLLTPILLVRFVQLLRRIVSKGLRKSYYPVDQVLKNKIRGKVLVGQDIKTNVCRGRLTAAVCRYDIFGVNTPENQLLKRALQYAQRYLEAHGRLFGETLIDHHATVRAMRPSFELVEDVGDHSGLIQGTNHSFFGEYKEAVEVAKLLFRRFGYTINLVDCASPTKTPPFWINMPVLFEMYVCAMIRAHNQSHLEDIVYQFSTYGNQIDILFAGLDYRFVIDTKYKLRYLTSQIHQDVRQVSGYARLKRVRSRLGVPKGADDTVDCVIIYPDIENGIEDFSVEALWQAKQEVEAYYRVWKIGVKLPMSNSAAQTSP